MTKLNKTDRMRDTTYTQTPRESAAAIDVALTLETSASFLSAVHVNSYKKPLSVIVHF